MHVQLLDANQPSVRKNAIVAICKLALNDSCEHHVVTEGGITPLVLKFGNSFLQKKVAASLYALLIDFKNACAIATHRGIPVLVEIYHLVHMGLKLLQHGL